MHYTLWSHPQQLGPVHHAPPSSLLLGDSNESRSQIDPSGLSSVSAAAEVFAARRSRSDSKQESRLRLRRSLRHATAAVDVTAAAAADAAAAAVPAEPGCIFGSCICKHASAAQHSADERISDSGRAAAESIVWHNVEQTVQPAVLMTM
jgi:hypothetical protein